MSMLNQGARPALGAQIPSDAQSLNDRRSRNRLAESIPTLLVWNMVFFQSYIFILLVLDNLNAWSYLLLHIGLCATAAIVGYWWARASSARRDARDKAATLLQGMAWTMLGGPFGAAMAATLLIPRKASAGRAPSAGTGDNADSRPELAAYELLHRSLLDRRLRIQHAHRSRALMDVVLDGTQIEKLDALGLISKRFSPALAPALKRALEDKNASVRVLAATVLAQQHNAHTKRIGALQAAATGDSACPERCHKLGQARLDYALSGLLEGSRADAEMRRGRADLARAEELRGHDPFNRTSECAA